MVCTNDCNPRGYQYDGYCEDSAYLNRPPVPDMSHGGRLLNTDTTYSGCDIGTDCADCGPRPVQFGVLEFKMGHEECTVLNSGTL